MAKGGGAGGLIALLGLALLFSKKSVKAGASSSIGGPAPFTNYTGRNLPHIQYDYQVSEEDPLAPNEDKQVSTFVSKSTGQISPGSYSTGVVRRNGVLKPIIRQPVDVRYIR